ncbi:MAG: leucine-rich repeat protein [Ruminococcus sp.]|nr:leucine-rich repeat protein [Ruminococcus sp.]
MNNLLKTISYLLAVIMLFSAFPFAANAVEDLSCGDFMYTIINNNARITEYTGEGDAIVVPQKLDSYTVTEIDEYAFRENANIKSVKLPSTVTKIDKSAFCQCSALTSVNIPNRVKEISDKTFSGCISLKNIEIPDSVTSVGISAFENCKSAETLTIGKGVTTIGQSAFSHCKSLKSVNIPDNVTFAGVQAFSFCVSAESIELGNGLRNINDGLFTGCSSISTVTIPAGIDTVYSNAFVGCTSLADIYVAKNVRLIKNNAFGYRYKDDIVGSALVKVDFELRIHGFADTAAETYAKNNGFVFVEINGGTPGTDTAIILQNDKITLTQNKTVRLVFTVELSAGTTLFQSSNESIATVDDYGVVTGVKPGVARIAIVNGNATEVVTVTVVEPPADFIHEQVSDDGVKYFFDEGEDGSITARVTGCVEGIKNLNIPSTFSGYPVVEISSEAFENNTEIEKIAVGENITNIAAEAFCGCTSLSEISLPQSLRIFGSRAFYQCGNISVIRIKSVKSWNSICVRNLDYLEDCPIGRSYKIYVDGKLLQEFAPSAGFGELRAGLFRNCSSLRRVVLPSGLKEIPYGAFSGCVNLEEVIIPDSVQSIGTAFDNCAKLKKIAIPRNVKTIATSAFQNCVSLLEVDFYSTVCTYFGYKTDPTFEGCKSLRRMVIDKKVTDIAYYLLNKSSDHIEIVGVKGSYAEQFAEENDLVFTELGQEEPIIIPPVVIADVYEHGEEDIKQPEPALNISTKELKAGDTVTLKVTNGTAVSYSSSNNAVASVRNGKVAALRKGRATITVKLKSGEKLKSTVIVKTSPKLSAESVTVKKCKTKTVRIIGKASTVDNKYTNSKFAAITSKASAVKLVVKGLKKGCATLKIKVNGVVLKLKVKVK